MSHKGRFWESGKLRSEFGAESLALQGQKVPMVGLESQTARAV